MKAREKIDRWSFWYWFLKHFIVKPLYFYYYRKIQIVDEENVPENASVIIAPNHQNALMDAMVFVSGIRFQTVFLARADVFKTPLITKILTFMKILPVYRIRDGRENLQKNDDIFDYTEIVLRNRNNPLLLFPEGNHGDKRRLRPLVKGIFRIAFQGQEAYGAEPGVQIVPTGIDYHHYQKFNQTQLVVFGKAIEVADYWQEYLENPATAMNSLRERLAGEMKKVMIHIESEEYYELYMGLRSVAGETVCRKLGYRHTNLYEKFLADKSLITALDQCLKENPERMENLNQKFRDYRYVREKLNFRDWMGSKKSYSIFLNLVVLPLSLLVLPVVLLGLINNWPHFFIPPRFSKKIKDRQFVSTAKWGVGMVIQMVYFIILFILALIFIPMLWLKLSYFLTMGASGKFALAYRVFVIKSLQRIRYSWKLKRNNGDVKKFYVLNQELVSEVSALLEQYREFLTIKSVKK